MECKLSDIALITMGQSPRSAAYNDEQMGLPFLQGRTTFGDKYPYFDIWTTEWNKVANVNDILFTVRAPVGDLNIATTDIAIGRGIAAIKPTKVSTKYLFYLLKRNKHLFLTSSAGTIFDSINKDALASIKLSIHTPEEQLHIVNTIGSVDDLIENYQLQIQSLFSFGLFLINQLNESNILINLSTIAKLEKGIEVGSSIYQDHKTDESIKYLRVGDLLSEGSTYIPQDESKNEASEDDILIAFDGAPGRNTIGLSGSFSSGIYKIICENSFKGLVYFELNSKINQKIISDHSQGTTILHASKAIPYLVSVLIDNEEILKLNSIFNRLVYLRSTIKKLQINKELLLDKYFTNQQ